MINLVNILLKNKNIYYKKKEIKNLVMIYKYKYLFHKKKKNIKG